MSNVVKHNKYNNQQNNINRVQSLNHTTRVPAPIENHNRLTYSSVARQALPQSHQTHDSVLKSHPSANNTIQQVVQNQPNLSSQVQNVNPTGAQMSNPAVPNSATNIAVMQQNVPQVMSQSAPRFAQPFHHRGPPQRPLLANHRTQNTVPTSTGIQQTVPQQVNHHNMTHTGAQHPHYFVTVPTQHTIQQIQNQQLLNQHMSNSYAQARTLQQGMPPQFYIPYNLSQQQTFAPQQTYSPYMYQTPHYQTHTQPSAQMMSSQMHQQRVTAPAVIQAPPTMSVQMSAQNSIDVNEAPQPVPQKPMQKRQKHLAVITDPNSGKNLNIEELAKEDVSKNLPPIIRTNESNTGASNLPNSSSTSSPKSSPNDMNIALQFATKVAVAASEPVGPPHTTTGTSAPNETVLVNSKSDSKPEDDSVAIEQTCCELSEKNNIISDICEPLNENSLIINTISTNSSSNSNFDIKDDTKLLNNSSAQNSIKINSQLSVEKCPALEINENGNITDSSNQSIDDKSEIIESKPEIAKDHSIQRINNNNNNNNRKKETIITKLENNRNLSELEENKVDNELNQLDVTDNVVTIIDKIEPQPTKVTTDLISAVPEMLSSLPKERIENEIILNNINENEAKDVSLDDNQIESESAIPSTKTALPDLPYKTDQWTPLNTEGKKAYDRDFLIAVRQKSALEMPESLTDARYKDMLRKDQFSGSGHVGDDPFLPGFASKSGDYRNRNLIPKVSSRQSQPGRNTDRHRKIISTSLTQDVKLHTTENAWKPTKTVVISNDPEEVETLELLKKIRGILNKLTPQKYESLVQQIMSFKINTEARLQRVLDLVFEKAVDEPAFCIQYANLCKHLSNFKVMVNKDDNNVEEVKFHKLLLSKCQKEFETDIYASITDLKERQDEIDKCTDLQKKKALWEVLDEDMRKARKRSLGNIKLIGELYKLNMLRASIMIQCIENLIKEADDESLECLCALFKTIGEQIESDANKHSNTKILDEFFNKMDTIGEQKDPRIKGTSSRVRFMLRDVIDMRRNGWKARRDENLPKMIDEIHLDIQKESEQSARDLHQHQINRKQEERERKQKGGRQANEDQWQTVTGRKSQTAAQQPNIDWQKMRNMQQQSHDSVQLGPQSASSWSLGSRGGAQTSQSRFPPVNDEKQVNRFSPLDTNDNRKSSQRSNVPSRDSSKGRSYQQSGRGVRSQGGTRGGDEREVAINLARNFASQRQSPSESSPIYSNMISRNSSRSGSREASAPNSRNSSMRRETPESEANPLKGSNISDHELEMKSSASIKEYLNLKNLSEPVLDVTNSCNDSNVHIYVSTAINCALDISSQTDHFSVGKLIIHLINNRIIKLDHFYKGLSSILDCAVDLELDVPKFWDWIGEVLAPIFLDLNSNRKIFLIQISNLCDPNKSSLLVARILRAVSILTDEVKANELWLSSDLNWSDFLLNNEEIDKFVEQNSVEFTTKSPKPLKKSSNSEPNFQDFGREIEALVKQNKSNDEIQVYISKCFDASQTSDHRFTSALFSAVISGCIIAPPDVRETHSYTLDANRLTAISPLLCKFLGGDPERELQALIVLQQLMDQMEHPPRLLPSIFEHLYEDSVISHDAFLQWEKSENSAGKAVAIKSVVRFMTWLRENDDEEEDNEVIGS